ncbi:MAG TPA: histidinol-phosphatase HisJ family protein [Thermomicrobiales bacterium]|nr:histidinol-phosphatase HisJ family protein [Thermomicrobiales bacterium]
MFDYHVHTEFSYDCNLPLAASCPAAIAAGVTEIAFTDHVEHEPGDEGYGYYRAEDYFRAIDEARARWGDRLTILRGAEVDFNERTADAVGRFLERYGPEYDFVIGSVHYGDDRQIVFPDYFAGRTLDDVFRPYFERIRLAVETGWFDTIGHLDLPKRYAPQTHRNYDPLRYRDLLEPVFQAMIARGVAFEINTSGLRQTPKTSMPGPAVVRWYADAGGRLITTGTDSHAAKTIGAGLQPTLAMLPLCGVDAVASFRRRTPTLVPIADLARAGVGVA